jgi:guanyl-specific ribonuclease Sa
MRYSYDPDMGILTVQTARIRRIAVAALIALAGLLLLGVGPANALSDRPAVTAASISACSLADLPAQATDTVHLIQTGGPFPYPKNDGVVFDNREGILPAESASYYHEYTVPTPGASNRGTRRIITGSQNEYYYTGDHYATFCKISDVPGGGGGGGSVPTCSSVPSQLTDTIALVGAGGPFPYSQDGEVFQNREGLLPAESSSYYHLYTVPTPGTSGRGDRRLVTGQGGQDYYSADNFASFCAVS